MADFNLSSTSHRYIDLKGGRQPRQLSCSGCAQTWAIRGPRCGPTSVPVFLPAWPHHYFKCTQLRNCLTASIIWWYSGYTYFVGGGPHAVQCSGESHALVCQPGPDSSSPGGGLRRATR